MDAFDHLSCSVSLAFALDTRKMVRYIVILKPDPCDAVRRGAIRLPTQSVVWLMRSKKCYAATKHCILANWNTIF